MHIFLSIIPTPLATAFSVYFHEDLISVTMFCYFYPLLWSGRNARGRRNSLLPGRIRLEKHFSLQNRLLLQRRHLVYFVITLSFSLSEPRGDFPDVHSENLVIFLEIKPTKRWRPTRVSHSHASPHSVSSSLSQLLLNIPTRLCFQQLRPWQANFICQLCLSLQISWWWFGLDFSSLICPLKYIYFQFVQLLLIVCIRVINSKLLSVRLLDVSTFYEFIEMQWAILIYMLLCSVYNLYVYLFLPT